MEELLAGKTGERRLCSVSGAADGTTALRTKPHPLTVCLKATSLSLLHSFF